MASVPIRVPIYGPWLQPGSLSYLGLLLDPFVPVRTMAVAWSSVVLGLIGQGNVFAYGFLYWDSDISSCLQVATGRSPLVS